jgi:broad specificity phosphatase PhoE
MIEISSNHEAEPTSFASMRQAVVVVVGLDVDPTHAQNFYKDLQAHNSGINRLIQEANRSGIDSLRTALLTAKGQEFIYLPNLNGSILDINELLKKADLDMEANPNPVVQGRLEDMYQGGPIVLTRRFAEQLSIAGEEPLIYDEEYRDFTSVPLKIIRHAPTYANERGEISGNVQVDILPLQHKDVQKRIQQSDIQSELAQEPAATYVSTLNRTSQTARLYAKLNGHTGNPTLRTIPDLREREWGAMEGKNQSQQVVHLAQPLVAENILRQLQAQGVSMTMDEYMQRIHEDPFRVYLYDEADVDLSDGQDPNQKVESLASTGERARNALQIIGAETHGMYVPDGSYVLVVAHSGILAALGMERAKVNNRYSKINAQGIFELAE